VKGVGSALEKNTGDNIETKGVKAHFHLGKFDLLLPFDGIFSPVCLVFIPNPGSYIKKIKEIVKLCFTVYCSEVVIGAYL
jgi:hypothetical protein